MGCLFYTLSLVFSALSTISFIWIILELTRMVFQGGAFNWTSMWFFIGSIIFMFINFILGIIIEAK